MQIKITLMCNVLAFKNHFPKNMNLPVIKLECKKGRAPALILYFPAPSLKK